MTQLSLVPSPRAPVPDLVDLRCCSCTDLEWPAADLVLTDPPWAYSQSYGDQPEYAGLPCPEIRAHLERLQAPRLAMWCTGPLLGEWMETSRGWSWGPVVSVGTWTKTGRPGQGYHWSGDSELLLMYSRGGAHVVRGAASNSYVSERGEHSRKPVEWQERLIRAWVPEGGLVLDPYCGLGSVPEAAARAGRRCLATEIDPERYARARGYLAMVIALLGCSSEPPEYYEPATAPEPIPLIVWAPAAYELAVLRGCDVWSPEGVTCEAAPLEEADVYVTLDDSPCTGVHGRAADDGEVRLYVDCLDSDRLLRSVVAHEIGHQLGIYAHVWPDCETIDERDPRAPAVCGPAIMNPEDTAELVRMTVADHEAWLSRSPCLGVLGC